MLGWAWLGRPVELPDVPGGRIPCVSYTPSSEAGSPLDGRPGLGYPIPPGSIERDVAALKNLTGCLRIYSTLGRQGDVVPAAAAHGMRVLVGAWIGADEADSALEIARAVELARAYPGTVSALVVGNEVLLRGERTGARLAQTIRGVKAQLLAGGLATPVAYAEVVDYWLRHPEVADAVDLMLVHVLPYWDNVPSAGAAHHRERVQGAVERIRAAFPGKAFEVGEAGWPGAGRSRGWAVPGRVNQARVVRELAAGAAELGVPVNLIEAIDQPWKRAHEGTVGGTWGLFDAARKQKFPLHGPVSEWPGWPMAAAFTAAVSCAAFLYGVVLRKRIGWRRWLGLGLAAPATGAAWVALADQVRESAFGMGGWVWGIWLLAVAGAGGSLLVMAVLDGPTPGRGPDKPLRLAIPPRRPPGLAATARRLPGAYQWGVMLTATTAALLLAVDGRYRDFPTLAYWLPAAAFGLRFLARRPAAVLPSDPQAGWCAVALAACGLGALEDWRNGEAWLWAACCIALAAPWLPHGWRDLRRVLRALHPGGEQQPRRHHGNRARRRVV